MKFLTSRKFQFATAFTTAMCLLNLGTISPVLAYEAHEYKNITQDKFDNCIKNDARDGGYTKYDGGNSGTLEIRANALNVYVATLDYNFNSSNRTLSYRLTDKSPVVKEKQVWDGIYNTVSSCGGAWSRQL